MLRDVATQLLPSQLHFDHLPYYFFSHYKTPAVLTLRRRHPTFRDRMASGSLQLAAYLRVAAYAIAFFECVSASPRTMSRGLNLCTATCKLCLRNTVCTQDRRGPSTSRASSCIYCSPVCSATDSGLTELHAFSSSSFDM
jgi:hypothetical protein